MLRYWRKKPRYQRWKDLPCSWISRLNKVKMAILPKGIYRFNTIPHSNSNTILQRSWKENSQIHIKRGGGRIAETILNKGRTADAITIPDHKRYYRALVIKTAWCWHENRHIDQWNQTEDPDINLQTYDQLVFSKEARDTHWK